jgi:hypothetical protein
LYPAGMGILVLENRNDTAFWWIRMQKTKRGSKKGKNSVIGCSTYTRTDIVTRTC